MTPGVVATLPEGSDPSRAGYEFLGWNTEPDGTGARIGVDVTPQPTEGEELEFYAIWRALEYAIVFDLSKNPDELDLAASLVWPGHSVAESSKNVFVAEGVTVEMGPEGRVELPDGRGAKRTDYRFLGWAEGEGVPVSQDADGTWRLDVSALDADQEGATLTARWAFKFGVIVPSDITFGRYDLLSQAGQGYATDETSSQDKLDGADGTAGTGEAAYFQSSTLSADLELAGLQSVKSDTASDVLFAKQGSQDQVWEQPLLSLFPLPSGADGAEAHGVHFKLDDAKDESAFEGKGFGIPKDSKLYASYRLNLDTAWSDGTSNSAIVGNGVTADNAKTRIAKVSYEFAVAGDAILPSYPSLVTPTGSASDVLYFDLDRSFIEEHDLHSFAPGIYGLADIKAAAADLSSRASSEAALKGSAYWTLYTTLLSEAVPFKAKLADGSYLDMQVIGICQDNLDGAGTRKAGLTLQSYRTIPGAINPSSSGNAGLAGWSSQPLRTTLRSMFDNGLTSAIAPVMKMHQVGQSSSAAGLAGPSEETVFLPSAYEVFGAVTSRNPAEAYLPAAHRFRYAFFAAAPNASKEPSNHWVMRSSCAMYPNNFCSVSSAGTLADCAASTQSTFAPAFCL